MKFNVLHVISRLPVGGVENMVLKVISGYDRNLFNPRVCCIREGGEIADELMRLGYKVDVLNQMKGHGIAWGAVRGIYNILKEGNIHILRTHQYHANLYGRIAGCLARVPVIVPSFHNLYESPGKPKFHRRVLNRILSSCSDVLVAVSNTVASDIRRFDWVCTEKIKVVYNGCRVQEFRSRMTKEEARKRLGLYGDMITVGSVARLTEQKGLQHLIKAASKLENCRVVIAGSGSEEKALKDLAKGLGVSSVFTGQLDPEKIPLFLNALDIFCSPSLWEGMPSALIEALSAGLPVVASDIPPHREVIGEAGIFVSPGNAEELAEALRSLVDGPALRETLAGRATERSVMFSIENTVGAYEELFKGILKKKGIY